MTRVAIVLGLLLGAGTVQAQVSVVGYYGNGQTTPQPSLSDQLREHRHYASMTMAVRWWSGDDWILLAQHGMTTILQWPWWGELRDDRPLCALDARPGCWDGAEAAAWVAWVRAMRPHIAAIMVEDERDCNAGSIHGLLAWTPASCAEAAAATDANLAAIRYLLGSDVPPLWINYTAAYADLWRNPAKWRVRVPDADWLSLDCYAAWDHCWGWRSVEDLYTTWSAHWRPTQRAVLLPCAYVPARDPGWGWTTVPQVVEGIRRYAAYADRWPRVVAVIPFMWWRAVPTLMSSAAMDVPAIAAEVERVASGWTGRRRVIPPVTGLRIVR